MGETVGATGRDVMLAYHLGVEIECKIAEAIDPRHYQTGFHATATCGTIRLRLLKIGALVRVSVRRVVFAMASACPWQHEFALAHALLRRAAA